MGGGSGKNYRDLAEKRRKWKNIEPYKPEHDKKEIAKEDKDALIALWEQSKEKSKKKEGKK